MEGQSLPFKVPESVAVWILRNIQPESLKLLNRKIAFERREVSEITGLGVQTVDHYRQLFHAQIKPRKLPGSKGRKYMRSDIRWYWLIRYYHEVEKVMLAGIKKKFRGGGYRKDD